MAIPRHTETAGNGVEYDPSPHAFDFVYRDAGLPYDDNWEHQEEWDQMTFSSKLAATANMAAFTYAAHENKAIQAKKSRNA